MQLLFNGKMYSFQENVDGNIQMFFQVKTSQEEASLFNCLG